VVMGGLAFAVRVGIIVQAEAAIAQAARAAFGVAQQSVESAAGANDSGELAEIGA